MGVKEFNNLHQFLDDYHGMSIAHCTVAGINLQGRFRFKANVFGYEEIEDSYKLDIFVPDHFPRTLPEVRETDGKIPRDGNFHVNPNGSLCLGSPLRLLKKIHYSANISGFTETCLVPYLYAVSYKLEYGGNFVFGELSHGDKGIFEDYARIFELKDPLRIQEAVKLLGTKKRIANKKPCPCGCGRMLGACSFHNKLNEFRKMAPVSWFKAHELNDKNQNKRKGPR